MIGLNSMPLSFRISGFPFVASNWPSRPAIERLESRRLFSGSAYTPAILAASLGAGQQTFGGLTSDAGGDLFGVTTSDQTVVNAPQSTLFEIPNGTTTLNILANFYFGVTGSAPVVDTAGDIFIARQAGAAGSDTQGVGEVVELPAGATSPVIVTTFGVAGGYPFYARNLTIDGAGDVFGSVTDTLNPVQASDDYVFELKGGAGPAITRGSSASVDSISSLTSDAAGNLYGTGTERTESVLFSLAAGASAFSNILLFPGDFNVDVPKPTGPVVLDSAGDEFGTAEFVSASTGGPPSGAEGFVYELPVHGWSLDMLHTFNDSEDGAPSGPLTFDAAGDLFGATAPAPDIDLAEQIRGTVYEIPATPSGPATGDYVQIASGGMPIGLTPQGPLAVLPDGIIAGGSELTDESTDQSELFQLFPAGQATSTVTVATAPTASVGGQPVTLTATVTSALTTDSIPTGTVTFVDNAGDVLGTGTIDPAGDPLSVTTTALPVGADTVTARYAGDDKFTTATSTPLALAVTMPVPRPPPPTVVVTIIKQTLLQTPLRQVAQFIHVVVNGPDGVANPTGTVTLSPASYGQPVTTLTLDHLGSTGATLNEPPGIYDFVATYSGDQLYDPAVSIPVPYTVIGEGVVPAIVTDPIPAGLPAASTIGRPIRVGLTYPAPYGTRHAEVDDVYAYLTNDPTYNPKSTANAGKAAPAGVTGVFLNNLIVSVKPFSSRTVSLALPSLPPDVAPGSYYLVVGATTADGVDDNLTLITTPFTVSPVAVSLTVTVAPVAGPTLHPGRGSAVALLTLTNAGPAAMTGLTLIGVVLTAEQTTTGAALTSPTKLDRALRLRAGQTIRLRIKLRPLPTGTASASVVFPLSAVIADGLVINSIGTTGFAVD